MSPEQCVSDAIVDHRTDIFSLGLTLFELATGKPARDGESRLQLLAQIQSEKRSTGFEASADVPRDLATIVLKATDRHPDQRYASAAALADDLLRFADGLTIHARRSTQWELLRRWMAHNPVTAGLLITVLSLIILLAAGSSFASYRFQAQTDRLSSQVNRYEQIAYARDIRLAQKMIKEGNLVTAENTLLKHVDAESDRRGFEWYHLWQACHDPALERTISQRLSVYSLDFLAGTNSLTVGAWSRFFRIWNLDRSHDAPPQFECPTQQGITRCVKHLPNRNSVLTIDHRGIAREYSLSDKSCTWSQPLYDFAPDERVYFQVEPIPVLGKLVIHGGTLGHGIVHIFDLANLEPLASKTDLPGRVCVGVTKSSQLLVGCRNLNRLLLLDVNDLSVLDEFEIEADEVDALCMSADRRLCAIATSRKRGASSFTELALWDVQSGQIQQRIGLEGEPFRTLEYSPEGKLLAAGQHETGLVYLFDSQLNLLRKHRAHAFTVHDLIFTHDSRRLVSAGLDGAVHVWNIPQFVARDQVVVKLDGQAVFLAGAAFLDNNTACTTCDNELII